MDNRFHGHEKFQGRYKERIYTSPYFNKAQMIISWNRFVRRPNKHGFFSNADRRPVGLFGFGNIDGRASRASDPNPTIRIIMTQCPN